MKKIVVAQNLNFFPDQIEQLKSLGDAYFFDNPKTPKEWLERCKTADIICSGSKFMRTEVYKLENKFITIPMVGYSWLDLEELKKREITLANCPGCNKYAVTEWIVAMTINLMRGFPSVINTNKSTTEINFTGFGLRNKEVAILGRGNIGQLTGDAFLALGANITYFKRNDNLLDKIKNADIIINCLSTNTTTIGLLDKSFFQNLKRGVYFISITPSDIHDTNAMISALDSGIIAGIATDCASAGPRDTNDSHYKLMSTHSKILATPHLSSRSEISIRDENDMMIDNIKAWISGNPINLVK